MQCTWKDCAAEAVHTMRDRNGKPWAHLCQEHFDKHDGAVDAALKEGGRDNIKRMLGAWVKASGGAKKMAESM